MIIYEFSFQENFQAGCRLLESAGLRYGFENAREEWRPYFVWLFEEAVTTEAHRAAVELVRGFERKDRFQRRHANVLHLAVPD